MKIVALVKFNDGVAMVLDEFPSLKYRRVEGGILGTDGTFAETYFYEHPDERWKAFGGRKFNVVLEDGEVIECSGQYWDGIKPSHREAVDGELIHVTANTIERLKSCYVYFAYKGIKHKIQSLLKEYSGPVYDYWDFEALILPRRHRNQYSRNIRLRRMRRQKTSFMRSKRFRISTNQTKGGEE